VNFAANLTGSENHLAGLPSPRLVTELKGSVALTFHRKMGYAIGLD
jgi:hypothetical protein